jgi:hypothetical protein
MSTAFLMFRNKAKFLNGLGLISLKIKKMSTVLEFLWMTGFAKISTVSP